ncbi:MAG: hypothetical protein GOMPHAMPRED_008262 [Gomphillus americanus]|uniref:Small ribosomal subunit protein bS18m n=1 Tax=Gomphillus americanus TaxID=1940652 RepID=A0A8H3EZJ3_9LECA|nr:MAG: hypothetical protein GOMPHAMPRED_008262 [Gomphillus americanus]
MSIPEPNTQYSSQTVHDPSGSTSGADAAGFQEAIRASRERFAQGAKAREERTTRERSQQGMERLMARKWQGGDLYTPHDLTPREILKFSKTTNPSKDVFDVLGLNPLDAYKNPVLLAEFMTSGGKIKHPSETGLRPVNQRKLAKTIRRAIGMGIMPSCHVHPEMLRRFGPDQASRKYKWR